jgi:hypothetical protein
MTAGTRDGALERCRANGCDRTRRLPRRERRESSRHGTRHRCEPPRPRARRRLSRARGRSWRSPLDDEGRRARPCRVLRPYRGDVVQVDCVLPLASALAEALDRVGSVTPVHARRSLNRPEPPGVRPILGRTPRTNRGGSRSIARVVHCRATLGQGHDGLVDRVYPASWRESNVGDAHRSLPRVRRLHDRRQFRSRARTLGARSPRSSP